MTLTNSKIINEKVLFFFLIIVSLSPVWIYTFFPTQDGPVHLENANIILQLISSHDSIYNDYFMLNLSSVSNWLLQLILAGLISFFPIMIAEKILISGFVILFPISFRYCLKSINPNTTFLSFISFSFIFSYPFCMGFYGFSYSMILFFISFGYWWKYKENTEKNSVSKIFILSFLFLITYLLHILSFVMLFSAICVLLCIEMLWDYRLQEKKNVLLVVFFYKNFRPLLISVLPTAILVLFFFNNNGSSMSWNSSIIFRLKRLADAYSLVCYDKLEIIFGILVVILLAALVLYALLNIFINRSQKFTPGFFVLVLFYLIAYFFSPDTISGGSLINDRLSLYFFLIFILWTGTFNYGPRMRVAVIIFTILLTFASGAQRIVKISELNTYLKDYMSGTDLISAESTILSISYFSKGTCLSNKDIVSYRINPFLHAAGYIAAQRNCVEFSNYQAEKGYFPLLWKPGRDPYINIGNSENVSETLNLMSNNYNIDYVLISCLRKGFVKKICG